jgi:hypothetical protein
MSKHKKIERHKELDRRRKRRKERLKEPRPPGHRRQEGLGGHPPSRTFPDRGRDRGVGYVSASSCPEDFPTNRARVSLARVVA